MGPPISDPRALANAGSTGGGLNARSLRTLLALQLILTNSFVDSSSQLFSYGKL